jgi:RNA polymerase sigma factor (sigma-70 family)
VTELGATVLAAGAGDTDAWGHLVDRFAGLIWAVARGHGLSVADADDVTQTTWLRLAEHLTRLRDPERVGLWLAVTARNESLRMLRRAQRDVPFDPLAEMVRTGQAPDVDVGLLRQERDRALWRAFQSLPSSCKVLLLMLTAEPAFTYEEVSASLDMPVGSIGPTRSRCLGRLRKNSELRASVHEQSAVAGERSTN